MRKVIVIETALNDEELKTKLENSFSDTELQTVEFQDYPFEGFFRPDYLDIYNETVSAIENDYEELELSQSAVTDIALLATKDFADNDYLNDLRNQVIADAIYKEVELKE